MGSNKEAMNARLEYIPVCAWSEPLTEPPRVIVPAPNLDFSHGQPSMTVTHPTLMDYNSDQFGDPTFVQALAADSSVTLTPNMLDWHYAYRRQAQLVLPFLYVGPLSAAKDLTYVRETNFTLLMSVRSSASGLARTMDASKIGALHGIDFYNLDIDSATDMLRKLPPAIKAVNDHLAQQSSQVEHLLPGSSSPATIRGKVLVFCETGNERSTAFVAAYLMAVFGVDAITAIQTVQSQRFSICIDDSTKHALSTFDTLLKAKRDVGRANRGADHGDGTGNVLPLTDRQPSRLKRTFESVLDEDIGIDASASERLRGDRRRPGEAPFYDLEH